MKENIDTNITPKEEKLSSSIIDKTKEWVSDTIGAKFIRRIEFLMKLEEIEWDVDDDSARIIGSEDILRLSPRILRNFEKTLNEYADVLDNEILKKLYYLWFTDFVLQHIDIQKFKIDKEFTVKLFVDWHIDFLMNCEGFFEEELINWLVEAKEFNAILNNIDIFKNTQYILNKIIDWWWWTLICENLYKHFDKINIYETTQRMEKNGVSYKDIYSFIQRYKSYLDKITTDQ